MRILTAVLKLTLVLAYPVALFYINMHPDLSGIGMIRLGGGGMLLSALGLFLSAVSYRLRRA